MGKNMKDLNKCKKKINTIYKLIHSKLDIQKVILVTRFGYMYDMGFGLIDGGGKPYGYHYEDFFKNKQNYNQKEIFFDVVEKTFLYFNNKRFDFYYLMGNPELGFSPKSCMVRPFNLFKNNCKLPLNFYLSRASEYRNFIHKLSLKYKNINILDPKDLYCDNKYCYAIKDGEMLYADDDHHSVVGSLKQAKYFIDKLVFHKANDDK